MLKEFKKIQLNPNIYTDNLIQIIKQANKISLDMQKNIIIKKKSDGSPVSSADLELSSFINESLKSLYPDINILCEENILDSKIRQKSDYLWIIDPIDGTKDYIKQFKEWSINIALSYKGEIIVGIVSAPAFDSIYYAFKNGGAYLLKGGKTKRIFCNKKSNKKTILISNFHNDKKVSLFSHKLSKKYEVREVKMSSSLKMCKIAEGKADIHIKFNSIHEWDIAACDIILEESGGCLLSLSNGKKIPYNKNLRIDPFIALSHKFDYENYL